MVQFPENNPNSYKTKLFKKIDLAGRADDWEVALIDVQFPSNWPNVLESTLLALIIEFPSDEAPEGIPSYTEEDVIRESGSSPFLKQILKAIVSENYFHTTRCVANLLSIPAGHYKSIADLGRLITNGWNEVVEEISSYKDFRLKFEYDTTMRVARFSYTGRGKMHFAANSRYLMETLFRFQPCTTEGCVASEKSSPQYPLLIYTLPQRSKEPSALEYLSSIYMYSNLARYQLVGNTEAPLLGIVPIQASAGEMKTDSIDQHYYAFNPTYYIPLVQKELEVIEIELKTDFNSPFPFANDPNSRVVCRLHFRKRGTQSSLGRYFL